MDELDFINSIEYSFPYEDSSKAEALARQAVAISPNAAFMILHEVVHAPEEVAADAPGRTAALHQLERCFRHPLAAPLLPVAKRVMRGESLSPPEAIDTLQRIAPFQGQYNALAFAYSACPGPHGDAAQTYRAIVQRWQQADRYQGDRGQMDRSNEAS